MKSEQNIMNDIQPIHTIVLGGGLTGLTTAHQLRQAGSDVLLLERSHRLGGQIQTHERAGFVYEQGPSTGILSRPEVAELFDSLGERVQIEYAGELGKRRLIYKGGAFHPLPHNHQTAITTPLFTLRDKLRILGEPWRKRGDKPNESVANLVRRRLGQSFYDYAVDPFIGGIYAGDPEQLITRYALPKLYALEQEYGSFVRGAIAKMRHGKTPREKRATKAIYSCKGGLSRITEALAEAIGREHIQLDITELTLVPQGEEGFLVITPRGTYLAKNIISTIGSQALTELLPWADEALLAPLRAMRYAPVVQVAVGYKNARPQGFEAFGGLMPSCEDSEVLGILHPSATFSGRAPEGGALLSIFLGGMRSPQLIERSDEELRTLVLERQHRLLGLTQTPDLLEIFRHPLAIPQYELSTGDRLKAIAQLELSYPGLFIGGNMLGGIGMPDRIAQGVELANRILAQP